MTIQGYRLFIDIPLGENEEIALKRSTEVLMALQTNIASDLEPLCRLGNDTDRQTSNYFIKYSSGHVSNKKLTVKDTLGCGRTASQIRL